MLFQEPSNNSAATGNGLDPSQLLQNEIDLITQAYQVTVEFFTTYTFQLIGAVIIFIIGYILAGKIANAAKFAHFYLMNPRAFP